MRKTLATLTLAGAIFGGCSSGTSESSRTAPVDPDEGPRVVNLDRYGHHANGHPVVFVKANGDIVVDCDNIRVWCDDEGA